MDLPHVSSQASAAIVDFQFQEGRKMDFDKYKLIIKEVAFCTLDSNDIQNYMIKPPYPKMQLSLKAIKHTKFMKEKIHGMSWNDGDVNYSELSEILYKFLKVNNDIKIVYVKGSAKKSLLQKYGLQLDIYDLNEFDAPRLDLLPAYKVKCNVRAHVENRDFSCAVRNVYRLLIWINSVISASKPEFEKYADMFVRLETFKTWPPQISQCDLIMAQAGFFYTGFGDKVTCFSCGKNADSWTENDTPIEVHKIIAPCCKFLNAITL